jgi:hypothetical protein
MMMELFQRPDGKDEQERCSVFVGDDRAKIYEVSS